MNKNLINILICSAVLMMFGCSAKYRSKFSKNRPTTNNKMVNAYTKQHDSHPKAQDIPDLTLVKEAQPKYEPKSRYGNPSKYTVLNKTYKVLDSSDGYKERGYASWYGTKFHGFRTSSGEIYDMYAMTAAHKTLPLPTYARVTNLNNNRSVIVKINDRGPFHDDRVVDLSYAAANKLGILANGVGKVEVVAINPANSLINNSNPTDNNIKTSIIPETLKHKDNCTLQLGAFSIQANAQKLADQLESLFKTYQNEKKNNYQVNIVKHSLQNNDKENILYKVIISSNDGELNIQNLQKVLSKIPSNGAFIIN